MENFSFAPEEFQEKPHKDSEIKSLEVSAVNLKDHYSCNEPIPLEILKKLRTPSETRIEEKFDAREKLYVEQEVEQFLTQHPKQKIQIENTPDLESILKLAFDIVDTGTDKSKPQIIGLQQIQGTLDISNPRATNCVNFNFSFYKIFKTVASKYNPEILEQHALISTDTSHNLELPRKKDSLFKINPTHTTHPRLIPRLQTSVLSN